MGEHPLRGEPSISVPETAPAKIKTLREGESTGWEGEQTFTAEEVIAMVKEQDPSAGDIQATDKLVNHDGTLLSMSMRAPGSAPGYSYVLKGVHGGTFRSRTIIDRIDYTAADSDKVDWVEEIAEYKNGAWVRV